MGKKIIGGILGVVIIGGIFFQKKFSVGIEEYKKEIYVEGIKEKVEIIRDSLGVPYIFAKNPEDLAFATGYVMAQDRLWQMYFLSYLTQGRLTEIFGEAFLEVDLFMRSLDFSTQAQKEMRYIQEMGLYPLLRAFTQGVNAYIKKHRDSLPIEFFLTGFSPPPWEEINAVYIGMIMNFFLAVNLYEELASLYFAKGLPKEYLPYLFPIYPDEELPLEEAKKLEEIPFLFQKKVASFLERLLPKIGEILPASYGSNNWAIAPSKSTTQASFLANDTHLRLNTPSNWYMLYQEIPGRKVVGITAPGVPFPVLGFNGKIAWGATMVMGDNQDIYVEKIHWERKCYFYKEKCLPLISRKESFFSPSGKKIWEGEFYKTHHGPILYIEKESPEVALYPSKRKFPSSYALSLRWALYDFYVPPIALYFLGDAKNIEEAREVLKEIKTICLNMLIAEKEHIAWQVTGRYPIRKNHKGIFPSPGWTDAYEWEGYYPFEKQPFKKDPPEGFLYTANHKTTPYEEIPLSRSWYTPKRAERIYAYLSSKEKFSLEDMFSLQKDTLSLGYQEAKKLWKELKNEVEEKEIKELLSFLEESSGDLSLSSSQGAFYAIFYYFFTREVFYEKIHSIGERAWKIFGEMVKRSYNTIEHHLFVLEESPFFGERKKKEILLSALKKAYRYAKKKLGEKKDYWEWGKIHFYYWRHNFSKVLPFLGVLFDRGPYPAGGDLHTVNVSGYNYTKYPFEVWLIPAMRFVVDFSQEEGVYLILPLGVSGNPFSPFYDSFIPYFVEGKYHKISFSRKISSSLKTSLLPWKK